MTLQEAYPQSPQIPTSGEDHLVNFALFCFYKSTFEIKISLLSFSHSVMSNSLWSHGLWPTRLLCPWDFPAKNTGVGCHSFSRESSRPRDQTCISCIGRWILYHWGTGEAPREVDVYPVQRPRTFTAQSGDHMTQVRYLWIGEILVVKMCNRNTELHCNKSYYCLFIMLSNLCFLWYSSRREESDLM